MRQRKPLNDGWTFLERYEEGFESGNGAGQTVQLPHTVMQTPFHCFDEQIYQTVCGYRRTVDIPSDFSGRLFVRFGAAAHFAEVFADGKMIFSHACGYTAFEIELTPFVQPGKSLLLAVKLDSRETLDQPPFGFVIDYMTYGGLYREAELIFTEESRIDDVFVMPEPELSDRTGRVKSRIGLSLKGEGFRVRQILFDKEREIARAECAAKENTELSFDCGGIELWDICAPKLYTIRTELLPANGGEPVDALETRIGFRTAEFREDGFYFNGGKLKIIGLNRHQSYPYVGYAMPASQQRFDADILKRELGVNAVRTSHYPQSQHFIDRCDEIGLLVFTEIPGWQHIGGDKWKDQAVKNTAEMVKQYRNHPSIILWGVRINESQDDDALYARTNAAAHALDPTRQTSGVRYIKKSSLLEDVYAYNDFLHSGENAGCEKKKKVTSDRKKGYFISEFAGHMFPTKSFDDEEHRLEQALRHANVHDAVMKEKDIAGCFGWCMFDYNTHMDFGSGDRICYHGVCDMFRNPKLAAAVYASNMDEGTVLEVSSSMEIGDHPASFRGKLFVFTNADSVRVYKNGAFIKEFTKEDSPYKHLRRPPIEIDDMIGEQIREEGFPKRKEKLTADLLNEFAGRGGKNLPLSFKLKMVWAALRWRMRFVDAYRLYGKYFGNWGDRKAVYRFEAVRDGKVVRTVEKTSMTSFGLEALPDRREIVTDDTYEVVSVRLRVKDDNDNLLPYVFASVKTEVEGPLEILGPNECLISGGMGGGYFRTIGEGSAHVTFRMDGCSPVELDFEVRKRKTGNGK